MQRRWLIVKVGDAIDEVRTARGDYDRWFREGLGLSEPDTVVVWDPRQGGATPDVGGLRAAVITGSSCMVTDRAPWSVALGEWLGQACSSGLPVLGVCYGHQLLAETLGGRVGPNPNGREIGTIEVELTPEGQRDPLFGRLGEPSEPLVFQATHRESVLALPDGAVRLGGNALDPNQAFRVGERTYAVQFHPEFDHDVIRTYVAVRACTIASEGLDPAALEARVRPSEHGRQLLRRFRALAEAAQTDRPA